MEPARSPNDVVDLVRLPVPVNSLFLSGSQTVEVAEVIFRSEERHLLHLLIGKTDRARKIP
jgi:hypothetical protein